MDLQTERIKRISAVGIADRIMPEKPEIDMAFTRFDRGNDVILLQKEAKVVARGEIAFENKKIRRDI